MSAVEYEPVTFVRESELGTVLRKHIDMSGPSAERIVASCLGIARFLAEKNRRYGDSALKPLRIFSKLGPEEGIKQRLDDKLSRLARSGGDEDEDVVLDLVGYLVLLIIQREGDNG